MKTDDWKNWMVQAQAGDEQAYAQLLEALYPAIFRFLKNRLGYFSVTEDTVQECLIAVHKSRHTYNPERAFEPWLYTVVKYKAIDLLRKQRLIWQREVSDDEFLATKATPSSKTINEEEIESLRVALDQLSPDLKEAVVLTKIEGLTTQEAADKLALSPTALRTRVSRAYKQLRQRMEKNLEEQA